ncbi:hypothetical protein [Aureispira anguillae]|uniref:Lipoprotein n=1 Tax=Aureispira anguillae TaxID=2864201 RepID=A0A915YLZ1_9BACT|nr:hypothetical protein [Aureispira anguillae]BDS15469.1 hypothetical protein AsAng_0062530 [Aureispira anguillae]
MKNLFLLPLCFLSISIIAFSCKKDTVEIDTLESSESSERSELISTLSIDGQLIETEDDIKADLQLFKDGTIEGSLNLYGPQTVKVKAKESEETGISKIEDKGNSMYHVTKDGIIHILKNVSISNGLITGDYMTENSEGIASVSFRMASSLITEDMNIEYGINEAFPWLIFPAIGGVITVVNCAYERSAARSACHNSYNQQMFTCGCSCIMNFSAGFCGGDCDIDCTYE